MSLPATKEANEISPVVASLNRTQKAAIILASLSAETAASIVDEISDSELQAFARAFSELKAVPPALLDAIAKEFVSDVRRMSDELSGGLDEARQVIEQLTDEERATRIMTGLSPAAEEPVWERLEAIEPETLCKYLEAQRVPVAAAITSKLGVEKTANVLELADTEFAKKVLFELSKTTPPSDEVLHAIAEAMDRELLAPLEAKPATGETCALVGEIINCLPGAKRDAFLQQLMDADPEIGGAVRKSVLTFEELHQRISDSAVVTLLNEVDRDILLTALRYGETNAPETVEFLFGNISKRMAEQYREDMEGLGDLSAEDGENAQRVFTSTVRRLEKAEVISLNAAPAPSSAENAE